MMSRNIKAFGLVLVAAFALSVVAASAASAQQALLTSDGPVTLTGTETTTGGTNALTAFGLEFTCPGSTFTGHRYNITPHEFILNGATTVTLTPNYAQKSCSVGKFPMTYDLNGCDYVLHLGETTGGVAGTYGATFDVVCPAGKAMELTMFTTEKKHEENKPFCIVKIESQAGLTGLHVTDTRNGYLDITGAVEGIKMKRTTVEDPLLCPTQEIMSGKRDLDLTIEGRNKAGELTGLEISEAA